MIGSELRLRIISAVCLAIPVLALTWAGGIWFRCFAAVLGLLVYYEFAGITDLKTREPAEGLVGWATVALTGLFVVLAWPQYALVVLVAGALIAALPAMRNRTVPWASVAIAYSGLFAIALGGLRGVGIYGLYAMLFIIAIVWATDIMAYFCGRAIGGRKLAPAISPGKTWSGALFGAGAGVAAGLAVALTLRQGGSFAVPLIALVLSIASQCGDLFESWIKRRFKVKDSSHLIPGHGGVMDRVDGLVFAAFAAFILAMAMPPLTTGPASGELAARLLGN
jgi:phosphatidate cytidylyltransferase